MPITIRRTRVIGDKIESQAFTSAEAKRIFEAHAIGSAGIGTILPTQTVAERALGSEVLTRRKFSYMTQFGTFRCGTPRYVSYSRLYVGSPYVLLQPSTVGTPRIHAVTRRRAGSFQAQGTPTASMMYIAYGSA